MKIRLSHSFENIISLENLLEAWQEFIRGKRKRWDVREFSLNLIENVLELHQDLKSLTYKHGGYQAFRINDPKPRDIHKACVCDRLLHHAVYRILYPFFDRTFIAGSYSCRLNKGTHKAINRFREFAYEVSKNNTKTAWILKCDIRKFFATINHEILLKILKEHIGDEKIIRLLENVISSFPTGLPLGNLTSQLFVNVYMNKFDQFVKHKLKAKYYIRYADDFVIFSADKKWLENQIGLIKEFLWRELKLELHPDKIFVKTIASGVDFLGIVNFSDYRVLRTKTKRGMFKKINGRYDQLQNKLISKESFNQSLHSYLGMLKHCNSHKIVKEVVRLTPGLRVKPAMTDLNL